MLKYRCMYVNLVCSLMLFYTFQTVWLKIQWKHSLSAHTLIIIRKLGFLLINEHFLHKGSDFSKYILFQKFYTYFIISPKVNILLYNDNLRKQRAVIYKRFLYSRLFYEYFLIKKRVCQKRNSTAAQCVFVNFGIGIGNNKSHFHHF